MATWEVLADTTIRETFEPVGNFTNSLVFRFSSIDYRLKDPGTRTFGYAKMVYLGGLDVGETRWYRFYPNTNPVILEIPRPRDLELDGFLSRRLLIKQASLKYPGTLDNWGVKVEQYV